MLLDFLDESGITGQDKIDSSSLSTESASSSNSVDVVFLLLRQLVVDDETNLLNVNTSGQQVSGNENSGGASSEFLHDHVSLHLVHLAVHSRDCEVLLLHGFSQLCHSLFGVAIDQSLVDVQV